MRRIKTENPSDSTFSIRNNNTGTDIIFPVMPQNVSESVSANFNQQEIVGASRPRIVYSSTAAKTITLSLQNLTEDYLAPGFNRLYDYVRALQALAYPEYEGGVVKPPDLTLFMGDRIMSCVCTNVSVSWGNLVTEQQIRYCSVDLNLLMTRDNVPGATWIMDKG